MGSRLISLHEFPESHCVEGVSQMRGKTSAGNFYTLQYASLFEVEPTCRPAQIGARFSVLSKFGAFVECKCPFDYAVDRFSKIGIRHSL